ncbi:3-deoxy-D-manno-octulosonic acid transferase [Pseudovibrio axinellae]|uniref:3-deoxy-D-manno-octulosonic acid transferase n=1 Tax=Pseudovibrio axinellae TaxID=989403 RepID=A0A165YDG6_9HYPH|nr:3-deoxy-D-manno-octulosonic acid transferase [Pseudovibrio axinellae]KZL18743.1 3-deoxy-D-manno-octulosonic acid transferase [Pseudovibrio axinellae]SEP94432.1 3-deoxy-D-manno-octulosonic-acid transferase [Pseudovibrio axinellae]
MSSVIFRVYQGLGRLAAPFLVGLYKFRARQGKEDQSRKGERFGIASKPRPAGELIWIQAASVGEANAVLPLARQVVQNGSKVLLTTATLTSAQVVEASAPEGVIHQFVPYDTRGNIKRFLNHWSPCLAITVESEIWPATFHELEKRQIPLIIVNGRMSEGSFTKWNKVPSFARSVFGTVDCVLAQSAQDGARFKQLGAIRVKATGNIKFDGQIPECDPAVLDGFEGQIKGRPRWLAASTHPFEEVEIAKAHKALKQKFDNLLTIIVPRHPIRAQEIRAQLEQMGLVCALRSQNEDLTSATDIYIADTLGELGLFYRAVPIVFMGGSLTPIGGHNLLEPAQVGCAILSGTHTQNFSWIYRHFSKEGGVLLVQDSVDLARQVEHLIFNPEDVQIRSEKAKVLVESGRGALAATQRELQQYLPVQRASAQKG